MTYLQPFWVTKKINTQYLAVVLDLPFFVQLESADDGKLSLIFLFTFCLGFEWSRFLANNMAKEKPSLVLIRV